MGSVFHIYCTERRRWVREHIPTSLHVPPSRHQREKSDWQSSCCVGRTTHKHTSSGHIQRGDNTQLIQNDLVWLLFICFSSGGVCVCVFSYIFIYIPHRLPLSLPGHRLPHIGIASVCSARQYAHIPCRPKLAGVFHSPHVTSAEWLLIFLFTLCERGQG